jgi:predicted TIM-barrel fold metal-dependent hydrolase
VIDIHCNAGKGLNFVKGDPAGDPWTTHDNSKRNLRQADEAGIDQSVIFQISYSTFEKANEEIAGFVRQYPRLFIGFAKHDPRSEAGKIRDLFDLRVPYR